MTVLQDKTNAQEILAQPNILATMVTLIDWVQNDMYILALGQKIQKTHWEIIKAPREYVLPHQIIVIQQELGEKIIDSAMSVEANK